MNVTRVVAQCNLEGEGMFEHDPWKTMEQLSFAHCVRDGVMRGRHPLSPGDPIQRRGRTCPQGTTSTLRDGEQEVCKLHPGHQPSLDGNERKVVLYLCSNISGRKTPD